MSLTYSVSRIILLYIFYPFNAIHLPNGKTAILVS